MYNNKNKNWILISKKDNKKQIIIERNMKCATNRQTTFLLADITRDVNNVLLLLFYYYVYAGKFPFTIHHFLSHHGNCNAWRVHVEMMSISCSSTFNQNKSNIDHLTSFTKETFLVNNIKKISASCVCVDIPQFVTNFISCSLPSCHNWMRF